MRTIICILLTVCSLQVACICSETFEEMQSWPRPLFPIGYISTDAISPSDSLMFQWGTVQRADNYIVYLDGSEYCQVSGSGDCSAPLAIFSSGIHKWSVTALNEFQQMASIEVAFTVSKCLTSGEYDVQTGKIPEVVNPNLNLVTKLFWNGCDEDLLSIVSVPSRVATHTPADITTSHAPFSYNLFDAKLGEFLLSNSLNLSDLIGEPMGYWSNAGTHRYPLFSVTDGLIRFIWGKGSGPYYWEADVSTGNGENLFAASWGRGDLIQSCIAISDSAFECFGDRLLPAPPITRYQVWRNTVDFDNLADTTGVPVHPELTELLTWFRPEIFKTSTGYRLIGIYMPYPEFAIGDNFIENRFAYLDLNSAFEPIGSVQVLGSTLPVFGAAYHLAWNSGKSALYFEDDNTTIVGVHYYTSSSDPAGRAGIWLISYGPTGVQGLWESPKVLMHMDDGAHRGFNLTNMRDENIVLMWIDKDGGINFTVFDRFLNVLKEYIAPEPDQSTSGMPHIETQPDKDDIISTPNGIAWGVGGYIGTLPYDWTKW